MPGAQAGGPGVVASPVQRMPVKWSMTTAPCAGCVPLTRENLGAGQKTNFFIVSSSARGRYILRAITLRFDEADLPWQVAVITVDPIRMPLATPVSLTGATRGAFDVQATDAVRSCVLPSENEPRTVNRCDIICRMVASAGLTVMDTRALFVTVTVPVPTLPPKAAVT